VAFLRSIRPDEDFEVVHGRNLTLRQPLPADYTAWADLRAASRAHLTPWEPTWSPDDLSRAAFQRRLRRYADAVRTGTGHMYFIFERKSGELTGGCQLSNIRQGVAQSAVTLGYWMGKKNAGQGLMTDAVIALARHAFDRLGFHRIEAACLASNAASRRVLAKAGFTAEGTARKYLRINGEWQDHLLFAIIAGDPIPASKG